MPRQRTIPRPCMTCRRTPTTPLIAGECNACYHYRYRHGTPRPYGAVNGRTLRTPPPPVSMRGAENPVWKGDAATVETGRYRAQKLYALGDCEGCGEKPAVHRHHRDRNTLNNAPENIARLCTKCHAAEHAAERSARYLSITTRICEWCGKAFEANHARFCGDNCRSAVWRSRRGERR